MSREIFLAFGNTGLFNTPSAASRQMHLLMAGLQKEGAFMGRLSANLSSLEHSMQSAHLRRQLTLRESDSLRFVRRFAPSNQ